MLKALLIDDDQELTQLLSDYLKRFQFVSRAVARPAEAFELLKTWQPDVIVLDVMLPEMDGFEVCKTLHKANYTIPIIMLTARAEVADRVLGLEIGADDYLPKPFEPRELVARMQAILRRNKPKKAGDIIRCADLVVQVDRHEATFKEQPLTLTTAEFEILLLFLRNPGKVLSREEIMQQNRKIAWESFDRSVDMLISRLRQKLKEPLKNPKYLKTIWGTGYLWAQKLDDE